MENTMIRKRAGRPGSIGRKRLESAVRPVKPSAVRDSLGKSARVVFQVSPAEKREIQETARGFLMTTSEYMVSVHRLFRKLSGGKTPKSVVKGRTDLKRGTK